MSRNLRLLSAVTAVIVVGWFVAMQSTSSGQNPARVVPTRWQYRIEPVNELNESDANARGLEGWEMVTIVKQEREPYRVIYKRRN